MGFTLNSSNVFYLQPSIIVRGLILFDIGKQNLQECLYQKLLSSKIAHTTRWAKTNYLSGLRNRNPKKSYPDILREPLGTIRTLQVNMVFESVILISSWEMVQHGKEVFSKDGIHGQAVIVSTRSANHFRRHSSAQSSMQYGVGSEPLFCLLALTQFARPSRPGNQISLSRSRVYGSGEPEAGGIKRAFSGCKPHPG